MAAPSKRPADYPLDSIEYYDKAASKYEDNSTNLKNLARDLLNLGPIPLSPELVVLDNACCLGTVIGQTFASIWLEFLLQTIYATDGSAKMIEMLNKKRAKGTDEEQVEATAIDSRDLNIFQDGTFTHIYKNIFLFFVSYSEKAAAEIHHTLASTSTAIITTWALLGHVPLLQREKYAVRPDMPVWLGPVPRIWMRSEKLVEILMAGGFKAEKVDTGDHIASMKLAERTMDALVDFTAISVMMVTKGCARAA
jgi:hypothetical protein